MCCPRVLCGLSVLALASALGCGSAASNDFGADAPAGGSPGAAGSAGKNTSRGGAAGGVTANGSAGGMMGGGADALGDTGGFAVGEEPVDDMEDGDAKLLASSGRDGTWFVITDTSGGWTTPDAATPFPMAVNQAVRGKSERSAGLAGGAFADWGAALVFNFRGEAEIALAYDASAYSGLSFYARSLQGSLDVRVSVPDSSSHPAGGICYAETCYDHYHGDVTLSDLWRRYEIPFSSLYRDRAGGAFNPRAVFGVEFVVSGEADFEFRVDDVAFTKP